MQPTRRLKYEPDPNKFDLRTHVWDSQGHLEAKNPYRAYIVDGSKYYERPVNSGNLWFENNQPAGRVELTFGKNGTIASKRFDFAAEHKDYAVPLEGAEKLHYELEQAREKNAQLEIELSAIRKEALAELTSGPILIIKNEVPVETPAAKQAPPTLSKKD